MASITIPSFVSTIRTNSKNCWRCIMGNEKRALPGYLIYAVCERFLKKKDPKTGNNWSADNLAGWLTKQGYPTSREQVFPVLRQAIDRGYLNLCPPRADALLRELTQRFPNMPADTRILDVLE